jgi:hypothetical protein
MPDHIQHRQQDGGGRDGDRDAVPGNPGPRRALPDAHEKPRCRHPDREVGDEQGKLNELQVGEVVLQSDPPNGDDRDRDSEARQRVAEVAAGDEREEDVEEDDDRQDPIDLVHAEAAHPEHVLGEDQVGGKGPHLSERQCRVADDRDHDYRGDQAEEIGGDDPRRAPHGIGPHAPEPAAGGDREKEQEAADDEQELDGEEGRGP